MRKKISICFLIICFSFLLGSCQRRNVLLFLNWGEYIDETMLEEFEKEYNCDVIMELGESNEIFYSKVSSGTTCFDVVLLCALFVGNLGYCVFYCKKGIKGGCNNS